VACHYITREQAYSGNEIGNEIAFDHLNTPDCARSEIIKASKLKMEYTLNAHLGNFIKHED
jgi:hypothetical protein